MKRASFLFPEPFVPPQPFDPRLPFVFLLQLSICLLLLSCVLKFSASFCSPAPLVPLPLFGFLRPWTLGR